MFVRLWICGDLAAELCDAAEGSCKASANKSPVGVAVVIMLLGVAVMAGCIVDGNTMDSTCFGVIAVPGASSP